jgi:S-adenosyl-L-methionine hydrolase (adenosine-forming)
MKKILTFLSDFGVKDSYAAQVKGRILSAAPDVNIIDITHECGRFDIISGSWLLHTSWKCFPKNTVHLAVVDPGVGTDRAILVLEKDGHFFIGPDNGIFSFIYPAEKVFEITWRPKTEISLTFHARDIMAPVAAMLLNGIQPVTLGILKKNAVSFDVRSPMIVHIDGFGNIITNIGFESLNGRGVTVNGTSIIRSAETYCDIAEGEIALIKGSAGTVEISANMRSVADMLKVRTGMPVVIGRGEG